MFNFVTKKSHSRRWRYQCGHRFTLSIWDHAGGWKVALCTLYLFLGYLSRRRCIIFCCLFINGMNVNIYSYLLSLARCQKPPYKICKVFARLKTPTTFAFSRRDQMQSSLFFCTHFQNTFSTWKVQTSFFGPHICCWYISFSRFYRFGNKSHFCWRPKFSLQNKVVLAFTQKKKKSPKANVIGQTHYLIRYTIQALGQLDKDGMLSTCVHELYSHFTM